jgi:hypothetical protein
MRDAIQLVILVKGVNMQMREGKRLVEVDRKS